MKKRHFNGHTAHVIVVLVDPYQKRYFASVGCIFGSSRGMLSWLVDSSV
ncbi:MAG: hypothetical protein JNJ47_00880 [Alphaproteobacteria bacterium]|nr:hypothetical protein [Alphaproteobacteria bacterium]